MGHVNLGERLIGAVVNPVVDAVDVDHVVARVDVERLVNEVDLDAMLARVDFDALLAAVDLDALLDRIDVDELLRRIDVARLLDRIDVQALIDRVDVQGLIEKVDVQALVERVDVDALVSRVDVDGLVARVDVDGLVARVDVDGLVARLDVDALASRLDIAELMSRAGIDEIVSQATIGVSTRVLNMARRQIVALDLLVTGMVARLTRRPRPRPPATASATGLVAGPVSRLLAYFVDLGVISVGYSLLMAMATFLVNLFTGDRVDASGPSWGWPYAVGYAAFAGFYWLVGLAVAGSSVGKALIGLRVMGVDGAPIRGRQGIVRVVVYPFSFILGLGLLPIVTARSHRALHDKVARTHVVYDWGDGDPASHSPLSAWLRGKPVGTWAVDEAPLPSRAERVARVARSVRGQAAPQPTATPTGVRSIARREAPDPDRLPRPSDPWGDDPPGHRTGA
jgi:uncharacterized RDD family membrane protein YckC